MKNRSYERLGRDTKKGDQTKQEVLKVYIASTGKPNPKEFSKYVWKKGITSKISPLRLDNGEHIAT